MDIDANGGGESPDEDKDIQDGVVGERQIPIQASDLKVDVVNEDGKGVANGLQGPGVLQVQQKLLEQQPQATFVCWERFLHVKSIRVLLVENDGSTRHVVTALLRNCNYEVIDAANGLQAWKILEDLNNQIDIILTEVEMPYLSGIGLLCKIMSHKTRKNVPVIMMSSHDSMGLVFKCLSKGAIDFLVKPIRKNELKNLWQHVWRRCHSSSGSGSESGTQTQKSVKSKSSEKADNSGSDDGENNGSNGLIGGDGSDEGSGTQSSWTKQAVEADNSQDMSPMDQVAECPDSTCGQVIRPNVENFGNRELDNSVAKEANELNLRDILGKCKDLDTVIHRNVESKCEKSMGIPTSPIGGKFKSFSESDVKESGCTREVTSIMDINSNATHDFRKPHLELSLKRLRGVLETGKSTRDDRCVLRRSEHSAFSRYNTSLSAVRTNNGITGGSSIVDHSVEIAKRDSMGPTQARSAVHLGYQSPNGVRVNIDMASTNNKLPQNTSAFRPVKPDLRHNQMRVTLPVQNDKQAKDLTPGKPQSRNHDDLSPADAPHCGSTNVLNGPTGGIDMKDSLNRSGSGSNHGSNGQYGSSTAINAEGANAEGDLGHGGENESGDASASGSGGGGGGGTRVDENKLARREAALIKFRLKRKERCFKKKVRYQNRKKLAEQRARVRGQFVKQNGADSSSGTAVE